jgi:hypothetical protein
VLRAEEDGEVDPKAWTNFRRFLDGAAG